MADLFPLLGEPLALDLLNTRTRSGGQDVDLLDGPEALDSWLGAQATRTGWTGPATAEDLAAVRGLREAVRAVLSAAHRGVRPPAGGLATVNRALALGSSPSLGYTGGWFTIDRATGRTRDALLHAVADSAAGLLVGPDLDRLRTCEHPECVLQFLAVNPRRRWCSAAGCGNRARVARHYSRQRRSADSRTGPE